MTETGAEIAAPALRSHDADRPRARARPQAVRRAVRSRPNCAIDSHERFEELNFQEIADTLDVLLSTVKSRLYTSAQTTVAACVLKNMARSRRTCEANKEGNQVMN